MRLLVGHDDLWPSAKEPWAVMMSGSRCPFQLESQVGDGNDPISIRESNTREGEAGEVRVVATKSMGPFNYAGAFGLPSCYLHICIRLIGNLYLNRSSRLCWRRREGV
jgi:hypothetical protein